MSHNLFCYCENEPVNNVDFCGYLKNPYWKSYADKVMKKQTVKICSSGLFESKYENQIKNSKLYKKYKSIFYFINSKKAKRILSKKFNGGFYYTYGFYDKAGFLYQEGFRYATYFFLTKKVSEWKKSVKKCDFSWIIKALQIGCFAAQVYGGSGYSNSGEAWTLAGDIGDKALDSYGYHLADKLNGVIVDDFSRYIAGKIYKKKKNEKVSIFMFAKVSVNLKKFFSKKWYIQDVYYGYPWEKQYYSY